MIWNVKGCKTVMFIGRRETNSQGWTWRVTTRVIDTPFGLAFLDNLKKDPHIGDMGTLLSLSKLSITHNASMIQPLRTQRTTQTHNSNN